MYQHHVILKTTEALDSETALDWLGTCKRFGPEGVVFSYQHGANEVAMEYGIDEGCPEFPNTYTVPLIRDLTQEEAAIVVAAWDYKFIPDFNIEISNQYDTMQDVELDIDPELIESATIDPPTNNLPFNDISLSTYKYFFVLILPSISSACSVVTLYITSESPVPLLLTTTLLFSSYPVPILKLLPDFLLIKVYLLPLYNVGTVNP